MLFQRKCLLQKVFFFVYAVTLAAGCNTSYYGSPKGYDLSKPVKMELGDVLVEISGLTYDNSNKSLLAISDSKRNVFDINFRKRKLSDYTSKVVPPDSDLEDLVKVGDSVYLLSSKGIIYEVTKGAKDTSAAHSYSLDLPGKNDFETLYYDPDVNSLILLCKSCAFEKSAHTRSAFRFDLATKRFDTTAYYSISINNVASYVDDNEKLRKMPKADKGVKFDPSAAAINPITKSLFILSSAGNLLVIADTKGQISEVYKLDPDNFPQAEGIAFAPNGDMFISNEGKYGKADLLIFPYRPNEKK